MTTTFYSKESHYKAIEKVHLTISRIFKVNEFYFRRSLDVVAPPSGSL